MRRFSLGVFPSNWKKARILVLKKTSAPSSPSGFRPIPLLYFLSEELEMLAHDQIMNYLNRPKILNQYQTGFRNFHSTQLALLKLMDDIRVGTDFVENKALDTISLSKLLTKLRNLGFSRSGLRWFSSNHMGRSQCVFSQSSTSAYCETNLEVPLGR